MNKFYIKTNKKSRLGQVAHCKRVEIQPIILSIGIIGVSLTNIKNLYAFVVVVPLLALSLLCFRKKPSKAAIKQNIAKKQQLTDEKAALTKRLDEVIRLMRSM